MNKVLINEGNSKEQKIFELNQRNVEVEIENKKFEKKRNYKNKAKSNEM